MKRAAAILVAIVATVAILVTGTAAGGDDGNYEVRAIFDNAAFLVPGEEVRVAGAKVGVVSDIDVSGNDEVVREDGTPDPGKAVVVLEIDDPGFQDFREDASCLIRPQSLIGEKFVECEPTRPRAPGTEAPPELATIADGEPGEGQRLLPLDRNGTAVDLDLVNNIMREPYPDRFRLILNSLGAGLAARGDELAEIVERSNPALRETNEVLGTLAHQNRVLAKLSSDSDAVISALARKRANITSFINQSETVGAATAERSADLERSFQEFPGFLRELRSTMDRLDAFSNAATPVFADLGEAAAPLTQATKALGPFADAGVPALTSLGNAADQAGPDIVASDPVIRQVRGLAKSGAPAAQNLSKLLASLRKTGGIEFLMTFIFNSGGSINSFDSLGHFLRAYLPLNSCVDYEIILEANCGGNFDNTVSAGKVQDGLMKLLKRLALEGTDERPEAGGQDQPSGGQQSGGQDQSRDADQPQHDNGDQGAGQPSIQVEPGQQTTPEVPVTPEQPGVEVTPGAAPQSQTAPAGRMQAARDLLDFLIGERGAGGQQ